MPKPKIVFMSMPPRTQFYYDWLVTGLEILREQGEIEIEYQGHLWDRLLRCHPKSMAAVRRLSPALEDFVSPIDYTCVTGRLVMGDRATNFAIDIADSPFVYSLALLETVDVYFKYQCPRQFDREGFPLNSRVRVPYHPDVFTFQHKIRPGMLGRPLGNSISLKRNLRVLRQWESTARERKDIRIFASFGSDNSPKPRTAFTVLPAPHNYQSEPSLLARWGTLVHHPNLKRARVVEMLREMDKPDVDARLWRTNNPKIKGPPLTQDQYVDALGRALINVNISGFRRSLPFRFMDTFLSGGLLATDTLAIRWYQEFEEGVEILEIGDLGYEPDAAVNWDRVREKLHRLYDHSASLPPNGKAVLDAYHRKWAPAVFAKYFLNECRTALEART